MTDQTISLIVPALNEQELLEDTVRGIIKLTQTVFSAWEVILINDGKLIMIGEPKEVIEKYKEITGNVK